MTKAKAFARHAHPRVNRTADLRGHHRGGTIEQKATMQGTPCKWHPAPAGARSMYGEQTPQIGFYAVRRTVDGDRGEWTKTNTPCPYCKRKLHRRAGPQFGRIVEVGKPLSDGGIQTLSQQIPETHMVLSCSACKQVFTAPKETDVTR